MPAKPIITFLRTISLVALMALFFTGCQTTDQQKSTASPALPSRTEVPMEDVRNYLADFGLSERVQKELFMEEFPESILSSRTPEEIQTDVSLLADARARVLSDISYYPTRKALLEIAGALLAQEHLVLQILYYQAFPEKAAIVDVLAGRLRDLRTRHPELPGGTAEALLAELDAQEGK